MILGPQQKGLPYRSGLLSNRQVSRPFVVVLDALIDTLSLDLLQHCLEFPDKEHVLINSHERISTVGLEFLLGRSSVLVERNFRANKFTSLGVPLAVRLFVIWA